MITQDLLVPFTESYYNAHHTISFLLHFKLSEGRDSVFFSSFLSFPSFSFPLPLLSFLEYNPLWKLNANYQNEVDYTF